MKRNKVWLALEILAGLALVFFLGTYLWGKWEDKNYLEDQAAFQEDLAQVDAQLEYLEEKNPHQLAKDRVQALKNQYPHVVGIIEIPGTSIAYPILQAEDNDFYLNHNREGQPHVYGEVFLDYQNDPLFINENSVIYGHNNRRTADIFHDLLKYQDQAFYEGHKEVYIDSLAGHGVYEIISVFEASPQEPYRVRDFPYNQDYLAFMETYVAKSQVKTGYGAIENKEARRLITLSTCHDPKHRLVVMALEKL
ncbi:MAG: class B sortase [Tissierellia bacterium]|nr:class B sortase [Tissierellia bacterium]